MSQVNGTVKIHTAHVSAAAAVCQSVHSMAIYFTVSCADFISFSFPYSYSGRQIDDDGEVLTQGERRIENMRAFDLNLDQIEMDYDFF